MSRNIKARNLGAQLRYRGQGNPASSSPDSAPSNCFPGLVADFRAVWRRILEGIVLHEASNHVVATDEEHASLLNCRLLRIDGIDVVVDARGPRGPGDADETTHLTGGDEGDGLVVLEWANALAGIVAKAGAPVDCTFTEKPSDDLTLVRPPDVATRMVKLRVRQFFDRANLGDAATTQAAIAKDLVEPGELTQGLCAPWHSDFRECACYYWAASRPDYVNVAPDFKSGSRGHNWIARDRPDPPAYVFDNRDAEGLLEEADLLRAWERVLKFVLRGNEIE